MNYDYSMSLLKHKLDLKFLLLGLVLVVFLLVLSINIFQPIVYDDLVFLDSARKLSLQEYLLSRYLNWTGRLQEAIITWVSYQNFWNYYFYEIISSLLLLILPVLIHWHAFKSLKKSSFYLYFLVLSVIWFATPSMGEIFFWNAGCTTYLFSISFFLLFLILYRKPSLLNFFIAKNKLAKLTGLLFFLFGLWNGLSQLQVFFVGICLIAFYYFEDYRLNKLENFSVFHHLGLIGFFLGGLILILGPGNYKRLGLMYQVTESETFWLTAIIQKFFEIFSSLLGDLLGNFFKMQKLWLFSLPLILLSFNNSKTSPKNQKKELNFDSLSWFLAASLVNLPLAITGFASERTLFFSVVFYLIFLLSRIKLSKNVFFRQKNFTRSLTLLIISLSLFLALARETKDTYKYLYRNFSLKQKNLKTLKNLDQKSLRKIYKLNSFYLKGLQKKYKFMLDNFAYAN